MMNSSSLPRHSVIRSSGKGAGGSGRPLVSLAVGILLAALVVSYPLMLGSATHPPPIGGVMGPYNLNNTVQGRDLTFPNCTLVSVEWKVDSGRAANFSVWSPLTLFGFQRLTCTGPPPECPGFVFPGQNYAEQIVCSQSGTAGMFSYTSDETAGYEFVLDYGYSQSNETVGEQVTFTAAYSCQSEGSACAG